jgi:hypothetical protein
MKSIYMLWKGDLPKNQNEWWVWVQCIEHGPPPKQYGAKLRTLRIFPCGTIITDDYYGGKLEYD